MRSQSDVDIYLAFDLTLPLLSFFQVLQETCGSRKLINFNHSSKYILQEAAITFRLQSSALHFLDHIIGELAIDVYIWALPFVSCT